MRRREIREKMQGVDICLYRLSKNLLIFLVIISISLPIDWQDNNNFVNNDPEATSFNEKFKVKSRTLVAAAATSPSPLPSISATIPAQRNLRRPPPVRINKCCRLNEYLDVNTRTCMMGHSEKWAPLIIMVRRLVMFEPKGEFPDHMRFAENVQPVLSASGNPEGKNDTEEGCTHESLELYKGANSVVLFSNGSLFLREKPEIIKDPKSYCVDRDSALVCRPRLAANLTQLPRLKVKKCCGKLRIYDNSSKSCELASEQNQGNLSLPINASLFQTLHGFPECHDKSSSYAIAGDFQMDLINLTDARLKMPQKVFEPSQYCLEYVRETPEHQSNHKVKVFSCLHHFVDTSRGQSELETANNDEVQIAVLHFGFIISVVFLAATLVASCLMPSVHHVLHWRCQLYYVLCLFVGYFLLAYSHFSTSLTLGSVICLLIASATHFFFLAAFFWLNTMCFNIWWTFRDFRPSSLERKQELLRLRLYSVYAWGIPLLITVIAACIDQIPETNLLRPGFGERSCWFNGEHLSIFGYFYGPVGILLCANIVLFVFTTYQLTCGLWKRDDVKSTTEKTALGKVCLKLVIVMGVTWIADVISWLIGGSHSSWFVTDLINALQGVFIFIVVGCQPQVWSACKRICCPRHRQEITNTTNGVQHSSSSQGLPSMAVMSGNDNTQNTSINNTTTTTNSNCNNANELPAKKIPMETVC